MTSNTETYDVVIIGGAMIGSSIAWSLVSNEDFTGTISVIERDLTYEFASTSRSNSCIRQQYSNELNVKISQYGAQFIRNFGSFILFLVLRILMVFRFFMICCLKLVLKDY